MWKWHTRGFFFPCVWIFPLSSVCGRYTGSRGLFLLYTLDAAQGLLTAPAQAETRVWTVRCSHCRTSLCSPASSGLTMMCFFLEPRETFYGNGFFSVTFVHRRERKMDPEGFLSPFLLARHPQVLLRAHTTTERFHFTLCAEHMVLASALNYSHIGTGDNSLSVKSWISKVWWI